LLIAVLIDKEVELDGVRVGSCDGGGRPNAIARAAETILWCPRSRVQTLTDALSQAGARLAASFAEVDPELEVRVVELPSDQHDDVAGPVSAMTGRAILEALRNQTDGVLGWSRVIPGLVETSNNLGSISTEGDQMRLIMLSRSSKQGGLESFQDRCERTLEASNATIEYRYGFPGWEARVDTHLLRVAETAYEQLFGRPPTREAIHAGLECGVLNDRIPGIEMIAFGPDIFDAHTPTESLALDTVEPFWRFVVKLVAGLV
jgi:dipeptidase D